jgi:hypothetical protein
MTRYRPRFQGKPTKKQPGGCFPSKITRSDGFVKSAVFAVELFDASRRIDYLLFPRVKRVADGTDFHMERLCDRRARLESVAARTNDVDFVVLGMNIGFHRVNSCRLKRVGRFDDRFLEIF